MAICHNKQYENEFVKLMLSKGHYCMRIAGSGSGQEAVCDCILFKKGKVYLVEVKATKFKKFYMRKNVREQLEKMRETALKNNVECLLAVKYKRRGWEIYEAYDLLSLTSSIK